MRNINSLSINLIWVIWIFESWRKDLPRSPVRAWCFSNLYRIWRLCSTTHLTVALSKRWVLFCIRQSKACKQSSNNKQNRKKQHEYLEPRRNIYCLRYWDYKVLVLDIEFQGWIPNQIRIWPNKKNVRKWNIFSTSTPLLSQAVSSLSFDTSLDFSVRNSYNGQKVEDSGVWVLSSNLLWFFQRSHSVFVEKLQLWLWDLQLHTMLASFRAHHEATIDVNDDYLSLTFCTCKNLRSWEICDFCWKLQYRLNHRVWKLCIKSFYLNKYVFPRVPLQL